MTETSFRLIEDFVDKLREHEWLENAWFIYIAESNTGIASGSHALLLANRLNVHCLRQKPDGDPGVNTDFKAKAEYAVMLAARLREDSICFMKDFICIHSQGGDYANKRTWIKNELGAQLKRARAVAAKNTNNGITASKVGWSAKCNEQGIATPGLNDDLAMALAIVVSVSTQFIAGTLGAENYHMFKNGIPGR